MFSEEANMPVVLVFNDYNQDSMIQERPKQSNIVKKDKTDKYMIGSKIQSAGLSAGFFCLFGQANLHTLFLDILVDCVAMVPHKRMSK